MADIPGIPIEAAASLGIPSMAVGNFSWDWIYEPFAKEQPEWNTHVKAFRKAYGTATLLLKLPLSGDMPAFPRHVNLPLINKPGRNCRAAIANETHADPAKKWILLSFAALNWNESAEKNVTALAEYEFFIFPPLNLSGDNIHLIRHHQHLFKDVAASVDAVISKPGYGIVSDCIMNRKPLLYAERTDFREYDILVDGIQHNLKNAHIPAERLYHGDIAQGLNSLWDNPEQTPIVMGGGAERAVEIILSYL